MRILPRHTCALLIASLLAANGAHALEIQAFDKMAGPDQDEYLALLVQGSEKVLNDAGRADQAAKVHQLFTTNADNGVSVGMNKVMIFLALVRQTDAERVTQDPHAVRLHVEHAMSIAFKKEGIVLPPSFMTVGKDFKPKHPLKSQ